MDWWGFAPGAVGLSVVPLLWVAAYLRRRRHRGLVLHDTTPPTPAATSGQLR